LVGKKSNPATHSQAGEVRQRPEKKEEGGKTKLDKKSNWENEKGKRGEGQGAPYSKGTRDLLRRTNENGFFNWKSDVFAVGVRKKVLCEKRAGLEKNH